MDYPETARLEAYDAELYGPLMARKWNCTLILYMRLKLNPINPPNGAGRDSYRDSDGLDCQIVRWPEGIFRGWAERFQRECVSFWDGKFWLRPPDYYSALDFVRDGVRYRPNIWCNFHLSLVELSSSAHHEISVVRLADDETSFRSNSRNYDHRDLESTYTGDGLTQRTTLHEVGHLMGLRHSGYARRGCANDSPRCYQGSNIMGSGEDLDSTNARPWRIAMDKITDQDWNRWRVSLTEILPRRL